MDPEEVRWREQAIDAAFSSGDIELAEQLAAEYLRTAGGPAPGDTAFSPPIRAAYAAARVALGAGRPGRVVELLASPTAPALRLPAALKTQVLLLLAEAHARCGRSPEARLLLGQAPEVLTDTGMWLRSVRVRLWLGEPCDTDACANALQAKGDRRNLAVLECEKGLARDRAGDLPGAEDCLLRAAGLSETPGRCAIHAEPLLHLARLDHLRGRLPSALRRYDEALVHAATGVQTLEVQLRRALVWLDLGEWVRARSAVGGLLSALGEVPEEVRSLVGVVRALLDGAASPDTSDESRAWELALQGEQAGAVALYRKALSAAPGPERRARLALALGLLAWERGDPDEARSWLHTAEGSARGLQLPEVQARCLLARGYLAAEDEGNEDAARRLIEEAHALTEAQAAQLGPVAGVSLLQRRGVLRHLLRAACRAGDAAKAFDYQERERGRLLLALLHAARAPGTPALFDHPDLAALQARLDDCRRECSAYPTPPHDLAVRLGRLLVERDSLFENLLFERGRPGAGLLPAPPRLDELRARLPAGVLYLAPVLDEGSLHLLAVTREVSRVVGAPGALTADLDAWWHALAGETARYEGGNHLDRRALDSPLDALGAGPLGACLRAALDTGGRPVRRVVWAPEGELHGLPLAAVRLDGRYLIERHEVVTTFGGALLVHQTRRQRGRAPWRPAVTVAERPEVLPAAAAEVEGVRATFLRSRGLSAEEATRAGLRRWLRRARVVHLACHAEFDPARPLSARVLLPSGESVHALEWLDEPVAGLPLVTLSACRSAEVGPLVGAEVFGLVGGLLGGGARAVLAGLWPVADEETRGLMWSFYRHRLTADLATALAEAQREALAAPGSSPFLWAAFALFGDPAALPAPRWPWRALRQARQRRHLLRFGNGRSCRQGTADPRNAEPGAAPDRSRDCRPREVGG
jgi:tetratricopeptide (TPR) repeat protein